LAIVEPVFANIRTAKGMDRFTYRSKDKVNTQWLLYCLVHNLEKIAHYGRKWLERVGFFAAQGLRTLRTAIFHRFRAIFRAISRSSSSNPPLTSLMLSRSG